MATSIEHDYTYLINDNQMTRIQRIERGWIIDEAVIGKFERHTVTTAKELYELLTKSQSR